MNQNEGDNEASKFQYTDSDKRQKIDVNDSGIKTIQNYKVSFVLCLIPIAVFVATLLAFKDIVSAIVMTQLASLFFGGIAVLASIGSFMKKEDRKLAKASLIASISTTAIPSLLLHLISRLSHKF